MSEMCRCGRPAVVRLFQKWLRQTEERCLPCAHRDRKMWRFLKWTWLTTVIV